MTVLETGEDLDRALAAVPNAPAVFLLWAAEGEPYLARTALLRRRLARLLGRREKPSRLLNLRDAARRIEYELTGSALESAIRFYELAREHFPTSYEEHVKLRLPPYVRIVLSNEFPRSRITTHLTRAPSLSFGPFRSRASAERFESQFLDLFQMRRCQEDLAPSPAHPGCIYGEMSMCLRPCQQVVGPDEYRHEVERVVEFLKTGGRSLLEAIAASRDRLSQEMLFEEAARQHKRCEKVQEVLKLRDELACDVDRLHGVAIARSLETNAVELWPVREGVWLGRHRFSFQVQEGKTVSLDHKLRETFAALPPRSLGVRARTEYLALLARWSYSTWCDGEWIRFESFDDIPYRRLVHAISRVAHGGAGPTARSAF